MRSIGEVAQQPLSLSRLQISEKGNERLLQEFPSLEEIFGYAIERYWQLNYADTSRTIARTSGNVVGGATTVNFFCGYLTNTA